MTPYIMCMQGLNSQHSMGIARAACILLHIGYVYARGYLSTVGNVCVVRLIQLAQVLPGEFTRPGSDRSRAAVGATPVYGVVSLS